MKESGENYLETIYNLYKENGFVKSVDISNALNVSRPSVNRASKVLQDKGLITQVHYGNIELTEKGIKKAEEIIQKHNNLTTFLIKVLELAPEEAEYNACRIEHIITDNAMNKINEYLKKN
ncbi:MAG: metal-dependent transcriptional regulator [Christensenellales bacterium]|jgi:DtxR family Mn-dependent transcriptional regulator